MAPAFSQVTWEPSEDIQIKQGKDITIKCRANNIDPLGIVRILRRVPSTGDEDVITDNQNLKPNFAISKRYNISVIRDAGGVSITLSYTGKRPGKSLSNVLPYVTLCNTERRGCYRLFNFTITSGSKLEIIL